MNDHVYMTYAEASEVLGIKPQSVKRRAALLRWPKRASDDRRIRVGIPMSRIPPKLLGAKPAIEGSLNESAAARDAPISVLMVVIAGLAAENAQLRERLADAREHLEHCRADAAAWRGKMEK